MDQDRPTLTIKLKPHLQEYLRCKLQEDEPMATKRNIIGVMIRPFLELAPKGSMPGMPSSDGSTITFNLPYYDDLNIRNYTVYISEENQMAFERVLNAHFKDVFFSFVDDKIRYLRKEHTSKGAIKKSILQFCSDYRISFNQMTYEMLKKSYYRRAEISLHSRKIFSSKLSLTCPLLFLL